MVEVIKLHEDFRPVAACTECDGDQFSLLLDAYGTGFSLIEGFLCGNCGHIIECRIAIIPEEIE